jgi:hypothetical protein
VDLEPYFEPICIFSRPTPDGISIMPGALKADGQPIPIVAYEGRSWNEAQRVAVGRVDALETMDFMGLPALFAFGEVTPGTFREDDIPQAEYIGYGGGDPVWLPDPDRAGIFLHRVTLEVEGGIWLKDSEGRPTTLINGGILRGLVVVPVNATPAKPA